MPAGNGGASEKSPAVRKPQDLLTGRGLIWILVGVFLFCLIIWWWSSETPEPEPQPATATSTMVTPNPRSFYGKYPLNESGDCIEPGNRRFTIEFWEGDRYFVQFLENGQPTDWMFGTDWVGPERFEINRANMHQTMKISPSMTMCLFGEAGNEVTLKIVKTPRT